MNESEQCKISVDWELLRRSLDVVRQLRVHGVKGRSMEDSCVVDPYSVKTLRRREADREQD